MCVFGLRTVLLVLLCCCPALSVIFVVLVSDESNPERDASHHTDNINVVIFVRISIHPSIFYPEMACRLQHVFSNPNQL